MTQQPKALNLEEFRAKVTRAAREPLRKQAEDGWIQDGHLLYRLTDGHRPRNRDEINVTMANSSRTEEARTRRASELLHAIRAAAQQAVPASVIAGAIKRIAELEEQLSTIGAGGVEATASPVSTYVEVRECSNCGHVGINDTDGSKAACNTCEWYGDSPHEDKCPGCNRVGTMSAACPKCGSRALLLAETHLLASAPAHPAEVVSAQAGPVGYVALAALTSRTHADDYAKCFATEVALLENYPAAKAIAVFDHAATHPTQQGLDARDAARYRWLRDNDWRNDEKMEPVIRLHLNAIWDEKIDAAMSAQTRNKKGIEQ